MFSIEWKETEKMWKETQECFSLIDGIEEIKELQRELFSGNSNDVCFGDATIDGLAYSPDHQKLTVYICYYTDRCFRSENITAVHYAIDFFEPDIFCFDIEFNTHWIDDVYIQKNAGGKYSITFGSGELDFQYKCAKVNRCWIDRKK